MACWARSRRWSEGNSRCRYTRLPSHSHTAHPAPLLRYHRWNSLGLRERSKYYTGVGVTKPFSSVPLFSYFLSIVNTHVSYWISRLYLTGVAAAQLRWHLSNMNVIQISNRHFGEIENFAHREINERSFSNPHPWCHMNSMASQIVGNIFNRMC